MSFMDNIQPTQPARKKKPEVCITGFPKAKKLELTKFSEANGLHVTRQVNKNQDYLVCGKNAGKAKMRKAKERDTKLIFGEEAFRDLFAPESYFE